MIDVEALTDGPDYTGDVRIFVTEEYHGDTPLGTNLTLDLSKASELFGKLGDALKH